MMSTSFLGDKVAVLDIRPKKRKLERSLLIFKFMNHAMGHLAFVRHFPQDELGTDKAD